MTLPQYALFKSFFPQLIAGPIVRAKQLLPQLEKLKAPSLDDVVVGLSIFGMGFFKKIFIADRCSSYVDAVFRSPDTFGRKALVLAILGYSVQIWADFSGYVDMGRGAARILGFKLPENFLSPYFAKSPSEFWRRWHITLSQWIRDYIYIPLGGTEAVRPKVFWSPFSQWQLAAYAWGKLDVHRLGCLSRVLALGGKRYFKFRKEPQIFRYFTASGTTRSFNP